MIDKFPEKSKSDTSYEVARGIISNIPAIGGSLSVLFENIFTTPLDKRKKEWFESLANTINDLTNKVDELTPEKLSENELFVSVSMQATQIALRNHQQEKINALKNAVKNSAISISIDENKALMFTRIIDDMTPLHLLILKFLNNPNEVEQILQNKTSSNIRYHYGSNMNIFKEYYPELNSSMGLINYVVKELHTKSFLHNDRALHSLGKMTSGLADEFLLFISDS